MKLLTWNVNCSTPHATERLLSILHYVQDLVLSFESRSPEPCCILLQEVAARVFPVLLAHDWVRKHFLVVPSSADEWPPGATYGNVTLVSASLPILSAQSLFFGNSTMGRHALFVDVALRGPRYTRVLVLRIANTHLESLVAGAPARSAQLSAVATKLREPGMYGGVAAGDMNVISPSDTVMHRRAGLVDSYKGRDDDRESFTWGYQPPSQYPPGRLDRIYHTVGRLMPDGYPLKVSEPQLVGAGLKTRNWHWASDHHGLITQVRFAPYEQGE